MVLFLAFKFIFRLPNRNLEGLLEESEYQAPKSLAQPFIEPAGKWKK